MPIDIIDLHLTADAFCTHDPLFLLDIVDLTQAKYNVMWTWENLLIALSVLEHLVINN